MVRIMSILSIATMAAMTAGFVKTEPGGSMAQSASGVGTHPAGSFTVNPRTRPKQVDSIAAGGPHAGQLTRGIYEILDANHKRACWGSPGGPRPTEFKSPPGSGRVLQYWKKIGPVPSH